MADAAIARFIRQQRVARLATVDSHGRPHIVPIVFVYNDETIYTPIDLKPKDVRPQDLLRVLNIAQNPDVQVLLDRYDEDWQQLGFVQLRGRAELLEAGSDYEAVLRLLEQKYPQYSDLPLAGRPVIRVNIDRVVSWGRFT